MRRIAAALAIFVLSSGMALAQIFTETDIETARAQYLAGSYEQAFAILVPAAEQGDVIAQNIMGVGHQYGHWLPVDAKAAVGWYHAAGEQGFGAAWHNLGYLYETGMPGLARDDVRARIYYERAVAIDYNVSRANLGTLLREGRGGPVDLARAVDLYEAGVAGGDPSAMDAMGWVYLNGEGVVADPVAARRYYQMAADAAFGPGLGNLGLMVETGRGGPQNLKQARDLYERAIAAGDVHSAVNMAWMIAENPEAFRNLAEGIAYCLWAVDNAGPDRVEEYRLSCDGLAGRYTDALRAEARRIADRM